MARVLEKTGSPFALSRPKLQQLPRLWSCLPLGLEGGGLTIPTPGPPRALSLGQPVPCWHAQVSGKLQRRHCPVQQKPKQTAQRGLTHSKTPLRTQPTFLSSRPVPTQGSGLTLTLTLLVEELQDGRLLRIEEESGHVIVGVVRAEEGPDAGIQLVRGRALEEDAALAGELRGWLFSPSPPPPRT